MGRTHREAPEIDGIVRLHAEWARPGATVRAHVTEAIGPDLVAKAAGAKAIPQPTLDSHRFDAIVHATPLGMYPHVNECFFNGRIPADVVFDMVYNPLETVLVKKARDAKVPVIYSQTATAGSTYIADIAPQPGDAAVTGRADKFYGTNLEQILKDKAVETAVVVGSAANGAVLYTTFGLGLRGITVVVAQDGISGDPEFTETLTRWQLLNEPGFANANNTPLDKGHVTLSTTDKITFK